MKIFKNKLPIILQSEITECGHACLAMIMGYYKNPVSLSQLRHLFPTSLKGVTLYDIIKMADSFNIETRALRIDMKNLVSLQMPSILHWDMNHFVVLKSVKKNKITIHNPAVGEESLSFQETSKHFTGIALEFNTTKQHKHNKNIATLKIKDLLDDFSALLKRSSKIILLACVLQIFILAGPKYFQIMIDKGVKETGSSIIYWLVIGFIGVKVMEVLTSILRSLLITDLNNRVSSKIGSQVFNHLIRLPLFYFEKRQLSDVLSRFNSVEDIRKIITDNFIENGIDGIMTLLTLSLMFFYNAKLAFISSIVVSLYLIARYFFIKKFRVLRENTLKTQSIQLSSFMESMRGILAIKSFAKENDFFRIWKNKYIDFLNSMTALSIVNIFSDNIKRLLSGIIPILVIFVGILLIAQKQFSIGMLYAFLFYQTIFSEAAARLADRFLDLRILSLYLDRLSDILLTEKEVVKTCCCTFPKVKKLDIKDIWFKYSDNDIYILKGTSFSIQGNEFLAISGPSGCGKTTLMKIMMGLIVPTKGEVLLDNQELSLFGAVYRNLYASVMQDDHLFSGTIEQNITFFSHDPNIEKMHAASKQAGILDDIFKMPMKFNSLIGDMGSTLSGGQKQRLLLARALYKEPKILFLDEASSHLDIAKESEINRSIQELNIIRVVVAHRPETLKMADRIIYLENGTFHTVRQ